MSSLTWPQLIIWLLLGRWRGLSSGLKYNCWRIFYWIASLVCPLIQVMVPRPLSKPKVTGKKLCFFMAFQWLKHLCWLGVLVFKTLTGFQKLFEHHTSRHVIYWERCNNSWVFSTNPEAEHTCRVNQCTVNSYRSEGGHLTAVVLCRRLHHLQCDLEKLPIPHAQFFLLTWQVALIFQFPRG